MGDHHAAAVLAIAAAGALGGWALVLLVFAVATRAREPDDPPATMELGSEPPAVVNMITSGWVVRPEAVPATLLDLAARRVVDIDQIEPERFVIRLKSRVPDDLTDYERQVLEHVRSLDGDHTGTVPCEALTTGPEAQSRSWWKRFNDAVVGHCTALGLCRDRWKKWHLAVLGVIALVPAGLAAGALAALPDTSSSSSGGSSSGPGGPWVIGVVLWFGLFAVPQALRAKRDTPAGLAAATHWLGVRRQLRDDPLFAEQPPAAVAIWDRYLSYGAAMGVAVGAVRALPLGAESDSEAWSAYGGHWHVVRVRYPRRFPPGWGQSPWMVLFKGLVQVAIAVVLVRFAWPGIVSARDDVLRDTTTHTDAIRFSARIAVGVLLTAAGLLAARGGWMVVFGASDLFARRELDGRVIRIRQPSKEPPAVAVDDGTHRRVRAWRVTPQVAGGLAQGADVHVRYTPRLGYVLSRTITAHAPVDASAPTGVLAGAASGGGGPVTKLEGVDVSWVSSVVGVPVHDTTDLRDGQLELPVAIGPARVAMLGGDDGTRVVLGRTEAVGDYQKLIGVLPKLLRRGVDGVGEEAVWLLQSMLLAHDADTTGLVMVAVRDLDPDARLAAARELATWLLA